MRNLLHRAIPLALALFVSCQPSHKAEPATQQYDVRGYVRGLSPDHTTVEIEHEAIPNFMPSMTMPFAVRDAKELSGIALGDAISFRLDVTAKDFTVAHLKKIDPREVKLPTTSAPVSPARVASDQEKLKEGDALPPFRLTTEASEQISADTLRGHSTVLTFIFSRCPMPNFCPRMSKSFAELQNAIRAGAGEIAEARLLSITLDPEFDTPAILSQYSVAEGADPKIWSFATGEPAQIEQLTKAFAVYRVNEGGTISHGLTTALITPDGKIAKLWRGNAWTPQEVVAALAARP